MVSRLLIGLLSNGHVLLEGVPGLAKPLAIKSFSQAVHAKFSRIQVTPHLLPADVVGTLIYNQQTHESVVRKGPIFANFILADEINRAAAKVQSLLKAEGDPSPPPRVPGATAGDRPLGVVVAPGSTSVAGLLRKGVGVGVRHHGARAGAVAVEHLFDRRRADVAHEFLGEDVGGDGRLVERGVELRERVGIERAVAVVGLGLHLEGIQRDGRAGRSGWGRGVPSELRRAGRHGPR